VTRTPLLRSEGQGHQAALLTAVLARQAAAAVDVGTCWPWETATTLPSVRRRKALRRPLAEEMGGGISWRPPPPPYSLFRMLSEVTPKTFGKYRKVFSILRLYQEQY